MNSPRLFVALLPILLSASIAPAAVITSTPAGGPWFSPGTWAGGVVPAAGDDVVIVGPVTVGGVAECRHAELSPAGSLNGSAVQPPRTVRASGSVSNHGLVGNVDGYLLDVEVAGDLHNAGVWAPGKTRLSGDEPRTLSQEPGHGMNTDLAYLAGATGDLIVVTPVSMSGALDLSAGRMVLQPDCPLTLDAASFRGNLLAQGNEIRFRSWSYLQMCTIDDAVLEGAARASFGVVATTRLTVLESLHNTTHTGGGSVTVEGDLVNHGVIQNDQYSFPVRVTEDIENNGNIDCPQLELLGVGVTHHLSMGPEGIINAPVSLPEFEAATIVAEAPVRFGDGLGLGAGSLILQPGCPLEFVGGGGGLSGTVFANGNEISVQGNGWLAGVFDRAVFFDRVVLRGPSLCTGGVLIDATVESWPWAAGDLTVEGTLENRGEVRDGDHPVRIRALGDLVNLGSFTNSRIVMGGTVDQAVGTGPLGLQVPEFVLESGLEGTSFQWYRDGAPLPGETGADLTLATVGADDYGTYHCVSGDAVSRRIIITETTASSGVAEPVAHVLLAPSRPNPVTSSTELSFTLRNAGRVSLAVYDPAGREVARLLDQEMGAGNHRVAWRPGDLPSGTYLYRLRAGGVELSRKCTVLR